MIFLKIYDRVASCTKNTLRRVKMKHLFACLFSLALAVLSAGIAPLTAASALDVHGVNLESLGLRPPVPQLVFTDPVGDLMPPNRKVENRAVTDIVQLEAKSNGIETRLVVRFSPKSDLNRIQGAILLDTDENTRTGFNPSLFINGSPPYQVGLGVDVEISLWDFPQSRSAIVTILSGDFERTLVPVHVEGQALLLTIPNTALGTLGRGESKVFILLADEFGLQDMAPNQGVGLITSTGRLRVSPGDSVLVRDLSRDPKFQLTAVVEQDDSGLDVTRFWSENGNNLTASIEANLTRGLLLPGKDGRPGQTFTFLYPVNSLFPGRHALTVIGISADALMVDTVVYEVREQISPPPLPAPPRQ